MRIETKSFAIPNIKKSYHIYKDDMTKEEIKEFEKALKEFNSFKGSIKEYRKEKNYTGAVITFGSVKYAVTKDIIIK